MIVLLDIILATGFLLPMVLLTAWALWNLGLHDPFLLTAASLLLGGALGIGLNRWPSPPRK